ncbi:chemotaxis protein CheD [Natranaerofaba carboxydovora]|uniref:chemotaxis protein CheD n=1 Tax=Natranaerofaba carboxydovora TaxID=2742683 RepID=UPI001F1491F4|nr:chemotaxis protein CheD [Natranaerofaba carboxydovora]UMZ73387.1 Chemoreceptor glutamine deamidase CheD [Natranaerofaba carboxydovora]
MAVIKIGIADLNVASGSDVLRTAGLGSCVGVTLYDESTKIGGMVHVMLPESPKNKSGYKKAKYADTGIPELISKMEEKGCNKSKLVAKIAGGAQMFSFSGEESKLLKIGERNAKACRDILGAHKIKILADDTGGSYGRTIELYCETGKLMIKTVKEGVQEV